MAPRRSTPGLQSVLAALLVLPALAAWKDLRPSPAPAPVGRHAPATRPSLPDTAYGALLPAMRILGVPEVHDLGLTGAGVRVGILAPAFRMDHEAFQELSVVATRDFVEGNDDVGPGPEDPAGTADLGTAVWSLVGGREDGRMVAPAFGAEFLLARIGGGETPVRADEERWVEALEWLVDQGARVVVSAVSFREFAEFSYGAEDLDGDTPLVTEAADAAAAAGVLIVTPVGDGGPDPTTLEAPADGDTVLAVGAGALDLEILDTTARGPTADGRSRPLVLAPGRDLLAAGTSGSESYAAVTGSPYAAALLGGAAALYIQANPERDPEEVVRALVESGGGRVSPPPLSDAPPTPHTAGAVAFPDGLRPLPLEGVSPAGRLTTLDPTFRWEVPTLLPGAAPVTYLLTVATDPGMRTVRRSGRITGDLSHQLPTPLPGGTEIFWRVEATTGQGIRRRTATRGPLGVPSWVELRNLNDPAGLTVDDPRPLLVWDGFEVEPPVGPLTFDVEVLADRTGERVLQARAVREESLRPDRDLPFNQPLRWRVVARGAAGGADTATSAGPFVVTSRSAPPVTILFQNFPNPFPEPGSPEPVTRVWFDLAEASPVTLSVHDLRGRLIRRLIPRAGCGGAVELPAGQYGRDPGADEGGCVLLHWDARSEAGERVAPGVYLLRLRAGGVEEVRRMVYFP